MNVKILNRNIIMYFLIFYFLCIGFVFGHFPAGNNFENITKELKNEEMTIFRLPETSEPISYDLEIIPYFDTFKFDGNVIIQIKVKEITKQILLHCHKLNVKSVSITENIQGRAVDLDSIVSSKENQLLYINLKNELVKSNTYKVKIDYSGDISSDLVGFYRSSYVENGVEKWLATTQFEPTYARRAFPCYDEPRYRAKFSISIAAFENQIAISNMPISTKSQKMPSIGNRIWNNFQDTVPMPTYLVAFVVSEFEKLTSQSDNKTISVWARKDVYQDGKYALDSAVSALDMMQTTFGHPYILPKIDLVAIPDFYYGAMENWGLTTYRESRLLVNERNTAKNKEHVDAIVFHEFTHQWFGNLITPSWWSYTWLNEAFARYYQYHLLNDYKDDWRMNQLFVVEQLQTALYLDGNTLHHAMTSTVRTPSEISDQFDQIIYNKGASILKMLKKTIGPDKFLKVIQLYVKKGIQNGGTVTPEILWSALEEIVSVEEAGGVKMGEVMKTWTEQPGYPLVTANRDQNTGKVVFFQKEYRKHDQTQDHRRWMIPITYTFCVDNDYYENNIVHNLWLNNETPVTVHEPKLVKWILVNHKQSGYYRVNYDEKNWEMLLETLENEMEKINILSRAQIIDDLFNLAIDGYIDFQKPFKAAKNYLPNEHDMIPWYSALNCFDKLFSWYQGTRLVKELEEFVLKIISPQYDRIKFDKQANDDHFIEAARSVIVQWACKVGHQDCEKQALKNMEAIMSDKNGYMLEPNVKYAVLCTGIRKGGEKEWNFVWNIYETSIFSSEQEIALYSLACSTNSTFLNSYFEILSSDKKIRKQNKNQIYNAIFSNREGVNAALQFLNEKLNIFQQSGSSEQLQSLKPIIRSLGKYRLTHKQLDSLKELSSLTTYPEDFKIVLEINYKLAEERIKKHERQYELIREGLAASNKNEDKTSSAPNTKLYSGFIFTIAIIHFLNIPTFCV